MPDAPHPAEPIAGRKDLEFTHFELIERTDTGTRRRLIPAAGPLGFDGQDLFHPPFDGDQMWADFAAVRAARPPIAGLSLDRPRLMGIVNVTPDSFSDGGRHDNAEAAIAHGLKLAEEGAEILDIGGESTRPGSDTVAVDDELRRVIPVIEGLRAKTDRLISIDTRKAEVMRRAVAAGADILNDVSALTHDPRSLEVAAESGLPVMLMHAQGDPKTMNDNPHYTDVTLDVFDFLEQRIRDCVAAGIPKSRLIADPGIGFGKHLHHNVAVLNAMSLYHGLGVPVLLGASRKKIIGQLCNVESPGDRVPGSIAAALHSIAQGVQIVRVHDVAETRQAIAVWEAAQAGSEDRALG
jgi:dihydropteroate synthase